MTAAAQWPRRGTPKTPRRPDLEFHGFVSALADYPELLRRLGLALDFFIVEGEQLAAGTGRGRIRLVDLQGSPEWFGRDENRPWTHFEVVERRFIAQPREREEELADGTLRVESPRLFLLEQIDVDGAAFKLASAARSVVTTTTVVQEKPGTETVPPSMTPDTSSLPALRGSGLTLYRNRRAERIVAGWDAAKTHNTDQQTPGVDVDLWAEDVTRGFRLDVSEQADPDAWFSLHARVGEYQLRTSTPGQRLLLPIAEEIRPDEGYVKAASATHNAAEPTVAYLHEASTTGCGGSPISLPARASSNGVQAGDRCCSRGSPPLITTTEGRQARACSAISVMIPRARASSTRSPSRTRSTASSAR